mgnify:CR=1 FL=1
MKEISMDELRKMQLEILVDVDRFCTEHNLRHWICGGTLIGAVRHKGYIPWDDDIDIAMPRPDYEEFIRSFNLDKYDFFYPGRKGYYVSETKVSYKGTILKQKYPLTSGKPMLGVHIDIIPQDGQPDDINQFVFLLQKIGKLRGISMIYRHDKNLPDLIKQPKELLKQIGRHIKYYNYSLSGCLSEVEQLAQTYKYDESKYVGNMTGVSPYLYQERLLREWFEGPYEYMEFEGKQVAAPSGWKEYLTYMYGDFMQLPPKEKQHSEHLWKAYRI